MPLTLADFLADVAAVYAAALAADHPLTSGWKRELGVSSPERPLVVRKSASFRYRLGRRLRCTPK